MTEKRFWAKIHDQWPGHAMRIEASLGGVDPGTPDSHLSIGGRGAFVELKVWPEPITAIQIAWHIDALDRGAGAEVWCWVGPDEVWHGTGERYAALIEMGRRPAGESLLIVLTRLHRILLSKANVV